MFATTLGVPGNDSSNPATGNSVPGKQEKSTGKGTTDLGFAKRLLCISYKPTRTADGVPPGSIVLRPTASNRSLLKKDSGGCLFTTTQCCLDTYCPSHQLLSTENCDRPSSCRKPSGEHKTKMERFNGAFLWDSTRWWSHRLTDTDLLATGSATRTRLLRSRPYS